MSEIFVPHVGNYKPGILPTDINNPGYWTNASARTLALVKPYLTAAEWHTLASECNALSKKHAAWSHPCGLPLLLCTMGICFCPLIYLACGTGQRVNDALAVSAIAVQLNARGIILYWVPTNKFEQGGLTLTFSAQTPPAPQEQQQSGMMQVTVPPGLQAGASFVVTTPDGRQMQVDVPQGCKGGDSIALQVAP